MAGYLQAGTHFLDARTRRYKHITQLAAGFVGYQLKGALVTGKERLASFTDYSRRLSYPERVFHRTKTRPGVAWGSGRFYQRTGGSGLRKLSTRRTMPKGRKYLAKGYGKSYAKRRPRRRYKKAGFAVARTERKFADTGRDGIAFATTWQPMQDTTAKCISAVKLEATESGRVGRAYYIHSVHVKGELFMNSQTAQTTPRPQILCRLSLVLDKQTNAVEALGANVYDEGGSKNWLAFRNLQFTQRFQILKTRTFVIKPELTPQGTANEFANGSPAIPFSFNFNFKTPMKVICKLDPATIASITDNSIHLMGVSSSSLAFIHMQSRIRFTD